MLGFGNFGYGKRKNDTEYPQPQNNESGAAQQSPSPHRQGENDERRGGANDYIAKRNNEIRMQAEAFKMVNPAFNMAAEMRNPQFCKYIWVNGLTVEEAYYLTHRNKYAGAAPFGGQYPQFPTGANPYSSMSGQAPRPYPGMNGAYPQYPQQNGSGYPERIQENGIGKTTPGTVKKNPGELTDEEVDDIIRRVKNGEKISF